jgi:TPR repeat protein
MQAGFGCPGLRPGTEGLTGGVHTCPGWRSLRSEKAWWADAYTGCTPWCIWAYASSPALRRDCGRPGSRGLRTLQLLAMKRTFAVIIGPALLLWSTNALAFGLDFKPFDEPPETSAWLDGYRSSYRALGVEPLRLAAARGDHRAAYALLTLELGDSTNKGIDRQNWPEESRERLAMLAEAGIVEARYLLGMTYRKCEESATCGRRASEELSMAAAAGYVPALGALGAITWRRSLKGTASDRAEAVELLEKGVRAGSPIAMTNLALAITSTNGVLGDEFSNPRARRLIERAADLGEPIAIVRIADQLRKESPTVDTGPARAALLRRAVLAKSGTAESQLGKLFFLRPELRDPERDRTAVDLLSSACRRGSVQTCALAGDVAIRSGDGDAETNLAIEMYSVGIAANQADAHAGLAELLRSGTRLAQDKGRAAYHTKLAADLGDTVSKYNFGLMLMSGDGVEPTPTLARKYFEDAAASGHRRSRQILEDQF